MIQQIQEGKRDLIIKYNEIDLLVQLPIDMKMKKLESWLKQQQFNREMRKQTEQRGKIYEQIKQDDDLSIKLFNLNSEQINRDLTLNHFRPRKRLLFHLRKLPKKQMVQKSKNQQVKIYKIKENIGLCQSMQCNQQQQYQQQKTLKLSILNHDDKVQKTTVLNLNKLKEKIKTFKDLQKRLSKDLGYTQQTKYLFVDALSRKIFDPVHPDTNLIKWLEEKNCYYLSIMPTFTAG